MSTAFVVGYDKSRWTAGWGMLTILHQLRSRLEALNSLSRNQIIINFQRRSTIERLMWAMFVEPGNVRRHLIPHRRKSQWDDQAPKPFVFEGFDEPLDHSDATVPVDSAVTRTDVISLAPPLEARARELHSFVADDVLKASSVPVDHSAEESPHGQGRGLLLEHCVTQDRTGVMINRAANPPAERPDLWKRLGKPWRPEAGGRWNDG